MSKTKALCLSLIFSLAGLVMFSCTDPDTGTGPGDDSDKKDKPAREHSVGNTNDGHDVFVFQEGELDDLLIEMTITADQTDDEYCAAILLFRGLDTAKTPQVGDIIASAITKAAPYGFLYKVLEVSKKDDVTTIKVRCASLEEAIENADFETEIEFEFDDDGELIGVLEKTANVSGTIQISRRIPLGDDVTTVGEVYAKASLTLRLNFSLRIRWFSLRETEMTLSKNGNVDIGGRINTNINGSTSHFLREKSLGSFTIWVGPIPIVITNDIEANLIIGGRAAAPDMTTSYNVDLSGRYGFRYERGNGFRAIRTTDFTQLFEYGHHVNGNVHVGVVVGLASRVYGFVGPYIYAGPVLNLVVDGSPAGTHVFNNGFRHNYRSGSPTDEARLNLDLNYGAAISLRVLSYRLSHTFADGYFSLATLNRSCYLPAFTAPQITPNGTGGINVSSRIEKDLLTYRITDFGVCAEPAGSNECQAGRGTRETFGRLDGIVFSRTFTANFDDLPAGTYNIRPFFSSGTSMFYDGAVTHTLQPRYTLTSNLEPADGGTITPATPMTNIASETTIPIIATPAAGYIFVNWTVNSGGTIADINAAATLLTVNGNTVITANFDPVYTLTVNRNITAGGTVTPAAVRTGLIAGREVNITAAPTAGYNFINWTVIGGTVADAEALATTVTVNENTVVTANFELIPTHTLTINIDPTDGGSVTPAGAQAVRAGVSQRITATAADGYAFVNWTVTGGGTIDNVNSALAFVTLTANTTVTANFRPAYTLTLNRNLNRGGFISPNLQVMVFDGDERTITATPAHGYSFINWTIIDGMTSTIVNVNSPSTSITVNDHTIVTANFSQDPITTFTDPRDLRSYRIVDINNRRWMAENLNFTTANSWCLFDADSNCAQFGRLYNWEAAMSACPVGWRLPNNDDWDDLFEVAGNIIMRHRVLLSTEYSIGTDELGFSALIGGFRNSDGTWNAVNAGRIGRWWGSLDHGSDNAQIMQINITSGLSMVNESKNFGCSVRCVQNIQN
ncbi:MAG: hypothetical protein FWE57_10745 [Chitinispirillia bacterium]|nr:hypothetical protein [Chitinispirillia bacterium]